MKGLFALAVLILDIWAIVKVFETREKTGTKVIWTLVILILPFIGFVAWWFAGPGKKNL